MNHGREAVASLDANLKGQDGVQLATVKSEASSRGQNENEGENDSQ